MENKEERNYLRKLRFLDKAEKTRFIELSSSINAKRLITLLLITVVAEFYFIFSDITSAAIDTEESQWYFLYSILSVISLFSVIISFIILFLYKRNPIKNLKTLNFGIHFFCTISLLTSIGDIVISCIAYGYGEFTLFFFAIMLIGCFFYLDLIFSQAAIIISFISLEIFISISGAEQMQEYLPYTILYVLITCITCLTRHAQLLKDMRNTERICQMEQEANRQNKLKSSFLANMSHEIRTPMNAIIGMSELALDYNSHPQQKNYIRQIHTSGKSLLAIINDILDFSKIESGKMEIIPENYSFMKLLYDISNVILVRIGSKSVLLSLRINPNLPDNLFGDDIRLRQIILNIAGNAAKFTEKGFIVLEVDFWNEEDYKNLNLENNFTGIKISVFDSGPGIKKDDLALLFNAFQQVGSVITKHKEGTGLGLTISKQLVEQMNGKITVESEFGKGSKFTIYIPQQKKNNQTISQNYQKIFNKAEVYKENNSLVEIPVASLLNTNEIAALFNEIIEDFNFESPEANILVVDDNTVNLQVAEGLLSKFKVKIHTATSGKESLKLLFSDNSKKYDIVFMDHMMPEMDGVETLEKIREKEKNENMAKHIVIALSANAMAGAKEMFIDKGFDDFLAKPVQGKDFAHILGKWLPKDLIIEKKAEDSEDFQEENIEKGKVTFEPNINFSEDFTKEDYCEALNNFDSYETYSKIVKTFYNSIKKNAEQIEDFYKNNEIKSYEILVHALKSSARIIGAKKLSLKAEKLEKAAKEKNIVFIKEHTEDLLTNYNKLIEILSPFIKEREKSNTEEKPELSKDDFFLIIKDIQTALESCDLPTIEEKAEFLKNHQISDYIFSKEAAEKLYQGIEEIDFEKIEEIVNSIE